MLVLVAEARLLAWASPRTDAEVCQEIDDDMVPVNDGSSDGNVFGSNMRRNSRLLFLTPLY